MEDKPEANGARTVEQGLGRILKAAREGSGLSQEAVAQRMTELGHSWRQTTVAKTEAGQRPIRVNEVASLAILLEFPISSLISEAEDASKSHQAVVYWQARRKSIMWRMTDLSRRLDQLSGDLKQAEARLENAWRHWKGESPLDKFGPHKSIDIADIWRARIQELQNGEAREE